MTKQKTIVISLGGSIIVPGEIQVEFLKRFRELILKFLKRNNQFVIVAGGGSIARNYQKAASKITGISGEDKDWLGIHATRLNAHLLRTIFKKEAYPTVLDSPQKQVKSMAYPIYIASGWKPGWSTDFDAVILAQRFGAEKVINLSNIDYIYDKNPKIHKDAKPIKEMNWRRYFKIVGTKWVPGMNAPFDPVASKAAQKFGISVIVAKGTDLKNFENILTQKLFKGTIIA